MEKYLRILCILKGDEIQKYRTIYLCGFYIYIINIFFYMDYLERNYPLHMDRLSRFTY